MAITFRFVDGEHILEAEQWVPRPVSEVFEFFSLETNLETLTPDALWHHTHTFEPKTVDGVVGTLMRDRVRFRLPLGRLGNWVAGAFVKRDVRKIFEYRVETIHRLFGESSAA